MYTHLFPCPSRHSTNFKKEKILIACCLRFRSRHFHGRLWWLSKFDFLIFFIYRRNKIAATRNQITISCSRAQLLEWWSCMQDPIRFTSWAKIKIVNQPHSAKTNKKVDGVIDENEDESILPPSMYYIKPKKCFWNPLFRTYNYMRCCAAHDRVIIW